MTGLVPLRRYVLMHLTAFSLLGHNFSGPYLCTTVSTRGSKCALVESTMGFSSSYIMSLELFPVYTRRKLEWCLRETSSAVSDILGLG